MNIHPLFVHFPIGFLIAYSILEITTYFWTKVGRQAWVFPVKTFLLFTGILGALVALITGGIAEDIIENINPRAFILEVHSPFAGATTALYFILAAAYLVRLFDREGWGNSMVGTNQFLGRIWGFKKYMAHLVLDTWFLPALALLAFIGMAITGALGAAIVYGPDVDPFVSFVYHIFWVQ